MKTNTGEIPKTQSNEGKTYYSWWDSVVERDYSQVGISQGRTYSVKVLFTGKDKQKDKNRQFKNQIAGKVGELGYHGLTYG